MHIMFNHFLILYSIFFLSLVWKYRQDQQQSFHIEGSNFLPIFSSGSIKIGITHCLQQNLKNFFLLAQRLLGVQTLVPWFRPMKKVGLLIKVTCVSGLWWHLQICQGRLSTWHIWVIIFTKMSAKLLQYKVSRNETLFINFLLTSKVVEPRYWEFFYLLVNRLPKKWL